MTSAAGSRSTASRKSRTEASSSSRPTTSISPAFRVMGFHQMMQRTRAPALDDLKDPLLYAEGQPLVPGWRFQIQTARFGPNGMEQLWNRGGANAGKRSALR